MGLFEHFPYTNFHDLNLDTILKRVKTAEASAVEAAEDAAESRQQATEALSTANQAISSAQQAINTSNQAVSTAQEAVTTAEEAQIAAEASQAAAEAAQTAAEEAAAAGPNIVYKMYMAASDDLTPNQFNITYTQTATQAKLIEHMINGSASFLLKDAEYSEAYSNCYLVEAIQDSDTGTYNCKVAALFNDSYNNSLYMTTITFNFRPGDGRIPALIIQTGYNRRIITTTAYGNT